MNTKSHKTIKALEAKINHKGRMPNIVTIHALLKDVGIEHDYSETQNTVEYRTAGARYVNSRHDGKKGREIKLVVPPEYRLRAEKQVLHIWLDTADSYYSLNSFRYAYDLLQLIKEKLNV